MIIETAVVLLCRVCLGMVLPDITTTIPTTYSDSVEGETTAVSFEDAIKLHEAQEGRPCYDDWYANVIRRAEIMMKDKCRDAGPEFINMMVDAMVNATMTLSDRVFYKLMHMNDTTQLDCFYCQPYSISHLDLSTLASS